METRFCSKSRLGEKRLQEFIASLPVVQARKNSWPSRKKLARGIGRRIGRQMGNSFFLCKEKLSAGTAAKSGCYQPWQIGNLECSFALRAPPMTANFLPTVIGLHMFPKNPAKRRFT